MTPEEQARIEIDAQLTASGWLVQTRDKINLSAGRGVAIGELSFDSGEPDYTLFVDGKALGTVEAKPEGHSLIGVEEQSTKYASGIPGGLPAWRKPLPFCYESTGTESRFTNRLEPDPRSRNVFTFHRPETLVRWVQEEKQLAQRLREYPPLPKTRLWPAQFTAITNLEKSLASGRRRALIQMATGSGKTFTAVNFVYRILKQADIHTRILFLVDRGNLGEQTLKEFQQFVSPLNNFKFTEEFIVQHLTSNTLDKSARVVIGTIQRLYSMLRGEAELDPELDEKSGYEIRESLWKQALPVAYNPALPIETFDFIITDECHRSIYNLWRQVLEYFDASLIGLTATPNKQTFGFFEQNLVMEYNHEKAVADGVNVNYDVYRIQTDITQRGSKVEAGLYVDKRDRLTRKKRWEQLDDELTYDAAQLDRDVVAEDQIRTVLSTYRDRLFTEIFPGRTEVPKTLIFAKDDSHADDIVRICREVFGKGNDFCQKITYRTTGAKPRDLIQQFRNSYAPRIAITVDMIATGTDVKPLEVVFFMRSVKSLSFFEQMKGRGVRVITETDLQAVTPDAKSKTRFVIVDAVGVCERDKSDSRPLDRKPHVPLPKLLEAVALGNREPDTLTTLAARLARLERALDESGKQEVAKLTGGKSLGEISRGLLDAVDPDKIAATAAGRDGAPPPSVSYVEPSPAEIKAAVEKLVNDSAAPIATNPELRKKLADLQRAAEQTIDTVSKDTVIFAGADGKSTLDADKVTRSFRNYLETNRAEITALQLLYSRPYKQRLTERMLKELEKKLRDEHASWTEDNLWNAFAATAPAKVKGRSQAGRFADLVSLVRFSLEQQPVLEPFAESVNERFNEWLMDKAKAGVKFGSEQLGWLNLICDHIATSLSIEPEDFDYAPFSQRGGLGKAHQLFGEQLPKLLDELNEVLTA